MIDVAVVLLAIRSLQRDALSHAGARSGRAVTEARSRRSSASSTRRFKCGAFCFSDPVSAEDWGKNSAHETASGSTLRRRGFSRGRRRRSRPDEGDECAAGENGDRNFMAVVAADDANG